MAISIPMSRKSSLVGVVAGIAVAATIAVLAFAYQSQAAGTVLVRGVVKPGGDADRVNVYITHVASAPDASAIRGLRLDAFVSKAKKYRWQVETGGVLTKVRTASNPSPEKEVVIMGTLNDDGNINATWMVQNYREFTMTGTLQSRTLDSGKTDEGWITVNVTGSTFRNVLPTRNFKLDRIKGKDITIRVNGSTAITALGSSKSLEDVTAGQQKVRIEGQLIDEDSWSASKVFELNS